MFEIVSCAVESALQARGVDRLHQIIDCCDFECRDRELVEGRHEHDRGSGGLTGERLRDVDAVESGHCDIQQKDVPMKRFRQVCRLGAQPSRWIGIVSVTLNPPVGVGPKRQLALLPKRASRRAVTFASPRPVPS